MPIMPCDEYKLFYSWFCCLAPLEAVTLTALIAIRSGALNDFVLKSYFDDAWTTLGGTVDDARYNAFIIVYDLRLETIEYEGTEIVVYMMDSEWWFKWLLFVGCPDFDINCPDGCFEMKYGK